MDKHGYEFLEQLITCSTSSRRNGIIPHEIKLQVGLFRSDLCNLTEDPDSITLLVQHVGKLALLGQYGYVDMLNEQYIAYNENSSPHAIKLDHFRQIMVDWVRMIKEDFFNKEIQEGDLESAQTSIEDMESVEMWAKLTDQFDVEDILKQAQDCLEEMYTEITKAKKGTN